MPSTELGDEKARLVRPAREAEERERQKQKRYEGEQREVGDHRRQVRASIGEELREKLAHRRIFTRTVSFPAMATPE